MLPYMTRTQKALSRLAVVLAVVGALAVVVAAFALTFDASRAVAHAAGIRDTLAWLLPTSVDGTMIVATVALMVMRQLDRGWRYPALVIAAGGAISIVCNGLHATGVEGQVILTPQWRFAVSTIPPLMLLLSVHLLAELLGALVGAKEAGRLPAYAPAAETPRLIQSGGPVARRVRPPASGPQQGGRTPAGALATPAAPVTVPARVSLIKSTSQPARRRGRTDDPARTAELLNQAVAMRTRLGRRPSRAELKGLKIGTTAAAELLKMLDAIPPAEGAMTNG